MPRSDALPDHWYQYKFPLPEVPGAPVPSQANYEPKNLAWMIEMFAMVLGQSHTDLIFKYENNTPGNRTDDIQVRHPNDKLYLSEKAVCAPQTDEMIRYEDKASRSQILRLFEENSPAGIKYFNDSGCPQYYALTFSLTPASIVESSGFSGYLNETLDELNVGKVSEGIYTNDGDGSYLANTGESSTDYLLFSFSQLPVDAPDVYTSVVARWFDRAIIGTGTAGGATLSTGTSTKAEYYELSTGYAYHQITWGNRTFTKSQINSLRFRYHNGANPLSSPRKRLTALEIIVKTEV